MKGLVVYRILLLLVSAFAAVMAFGFIPFLVLMFANPAFGLFAFVIACVALYAIYASKFFRQVILRGLPFTKKQSDMLTVNAIVVFIFSLLSLQGSVAQLQRPMALPEMPAEMAGSLPSAETMQIIVIISLIFSVILLVHVVWTFVLHRKHKRQNLPE